LASACSGIYSSADRGDLWRKLMGIPNTSRRTHVVREDPLNEATIFAGTTTGLFKSVNRGLTWKTLSDTQVNALVFDPRQPQNLYLAFEYEGIGKSTTGGERIEMINQGFVDRTISWTGVSGGNLLALETQLGETSGIFVSGNQGSSWTQLHVARGLSGVHLSSIAGFASEPRILLGASPRQMYKSIDAGASWKPLTIHLVVPPPPETKKAAPATRTSRTSRTRTTHARTTRTIKPRPIIKEISPSQISGLYTLKSGTHEVLFAATDLGLLKSEDMGERWTLAQMPGTLAVTALYVAPNSDGRLIARTSGGLYSSTDYGDHWTLLSFPLPVSDVNDVAIPASDTAPLLVATRVGLYSSSDSGKQWFANPGKLPASTVTSVIYSNATNSAYAVEYGRLYATQDGGNSWSALPTALPFMRIRQLWIPSGASKRLYGITGGLGIIFRNL